MITRKNTFIQTYGTDKLGEIVSIQNKKNTRSKTITYVVSFTSNHSEIVLDIRTIFTRNISLPK